MSKQTNVSSDLILASFRKRWLASIAPRRVGRPAARLPRLTSRSPQDVPSVLMQPSALKVALFSRNFHQTLICFAVHHDSAPCGYSGERRLRLSAEKSVKRRCLRVLYSVRCLRGGVPRPRRNVTKTPRRRSEAQDLLCAMCGFGCSKKMLVVQKCVFALNNNPLNVSVSTF